MGAGAVPEGFVIRPYDASSPGDRTGIRAVFGLTGLLGQPVVRYFPHPDLMADAMLEYYLRYERPWAFVAVETTSHTLAGYITGCSDTRARDRRIVRMAPVLAASFLRSGVAGWAASCRLALQGAGELVRRAPGGQARELAALPAHLHMAVHPGFHRRGLGGALLTALLDRLGAAGVRGIHLVTTNRHQAALGLYERHGFAELSRRRTRAFDHLLPPEMLPVERIVMGRRL